MAFAVLLARKDGDKESGGLGLGWILAIALCGGILFFAAMGYLLVWRIRQMKKPITRRVYANDDPEIRENQDPPTSFLSRSRQRLTSSSTMVLSKRYMQSQSSLGRLSSHLSMNNMVPWKPPILPPLPTHVSGDPRRRTSDPANWDDDQETSGSRANLGRRSWRESLFGRDSWMALMMMGSSPTLPHLEFEKEEEEANKHREIKMVIRDGSEEDVTNQEDTALEPPKPIPQEEPQKNELHVQKKRQSKPSPTLGSSQTTPDFSSQQESEDDPPRGRPRKVGHMQNPPRLPQPREPEEAYQRDVRQLQQYYYRQRMRASATETDLKDILRSTEQRLRDGSSRSPVKNLPRGSQSKERRPQTKTPSPSRSAGRTTPSPSRSMGRTTPSPSKRPLRSPASGKSPGRVTPSPSRMNLNQTTPTKTHNRSMSIGSLSAAHSLINLAAAELGSPKSSKGSPNRPRSREWGPSARQESQPSVPQKSSQRLQQQPQQQKQQQKPQQPRQQQQQQQSRKQQRRRSMSVGSDVSSCLSTLYSVGETEEEEVVKPLAARYDVDPFSEMRQIHQQTHPNGPRPLRRTKTVGSSGLNDQDMDASAMPAPLRTISVNSHLGRTGRPQSVEKRNSMRLSVVLDPPVKNTPSEDVKPKSSLLEAPKRNSLVEAASAASILSDVSVYTDASVSDVSDDTVIGDEAQRARSTTPSNKSTPAKSTRSIDMSSSPMDDRDLISILRNGIPPRRDLPMPPSKITLNDNEDGIFTTPLSPQPKNRQPSRPPSRRGSISSIGSSVYDDLDDGPSALPSRFSNASALGSAVLGAAHSVGSTVAQLRRMNSIISSYSVASVASTVFGDTPEEDDSLPTLPSLRGGGFSPDRTMSKNEASGRKNYLNLSPGSRDSLCPTTKRSSRGRTPSVSGSPVRSARKSDNKENQGSNGRTVRFDVPSPVASRDGGYSTNPSRNGGLMSQRASVESMGLYDQDGFLVGSPDRDMTAMGGRLRM